MYENTSITDEPEIVLNEINGRPVSSIETETIKEAARDVFRELNICKDKTLSNELLLSIKNLQELVN